MYVLGLAGSPRRGGNTETLLDQALAGAASQGAKTEKIVLSEVAMRPCQACGGCAKTGICIIGDQAQEIQRKLREADRLILASPLFFLGVSAQAKTIIDRCQALWVTRYILKQRHTLDSTGGRRRALFISVGGQRRPNMFEGALTTAKAFFATCDFAFEDAILYSGIEEKSDIKKHPTALQEAFEAGARLAQP
ncbi:MAG: flavodoxin family protein [Chloroflexota bacterium]